jgi:hypothetical protein
MYTIRIFGELSKTMRMSERNLSNGILPICIEVLNNVDKFKKEVRIWALIVSVYLRLDY